MNVLDEKTRRIMTASYALPDLETAVQQVIYNALDAHAKKIKLSVDIENASFLAVDDGCGIEPNNLYIYVGERYASSKRPISSKNDDQQKQQKPYGSRGAFLYELNSIASTVEIESRVQEHWTSYRKVFKEGKVVLNARSKCLREIPGTTVYVSNLFRMLPVRRKYLSRNMKRRNRVIQSIQNFCVSMSMIWPSLSFDIRFQGEKARPIIIPPARSCRERFIEHFGHLLGNQLQYVSFSSETAQFSVQGYFAFIPGASEAMGHGIKQAKSYYQFAFLDNDWNEECNQVCSRTITEAALEFSSAIPIFVLKVKAASGQFDACEIRRKERVRFKAPDQFRQFLFQFVQELAVAEANQVKIRESSRCEVLSHKTSNDQSTYDPLPNEFDSTQISPSPFLDNTMTTHDVDYDSCESDNYYHYDEVSVACAAENCAIWSSESHNMCQASNYADDDSEDTGFDDNDLQFNKLHGFTTAACQMSEVSRDVASTDFAQKYAGTDRREGDLEDIFFSHEPSSPFAKPTRRAGDDENEKIRVFAIPWLSSKPDTYDCADVLLDLCEDSSYSEDAHCFEDARCSDAAEQQIQDLQLELVILEQTHDNNNARLSLNASSNVCVTSNYFSMRTVEPSTNKSLKHWHSSKSYPVKRFAAALHVDNIHVFGEDRAVTISKSTLAKLQVICQVDRKFILVQAETSQGKLLLCIDQHAADERVLLEKLEADMFGHDGSLRRVEVHDHDPPLALQVNSKERDALQYNEELVNDWGFEFEFIASKPEQAFVNACNQTAVHKADRVMLYATPKVEKRVSNVDDFRDFLQLLSSAGETYLHSTIRPPVITRLLHSRACRSAIMFGDRLSLTQCKDLIAELKMCQLPFQCAHGRPSVVPLAEIRDGNLT
ncbi:unnamed protein product [Peronospora destructor]|uniref:MutL C-terminal dimerisation domain-containing protein n=1 Tax=Peronospora destructor TaxID=86335 RepID=A0AAV0V4E4_9STRA|nr:unnamed protein product [Peronospora destructor]